MIAPLHIDLDGVSEGVWWSVVTLSTVGYGDKTPETPVGKGPQDVLTTILVLFLCLPFLSRAYHQSTGLSISSLASSSLQSPLEKWPVIFNKYSLLTIGGFKHSIFTR